MKFSCGLFNNIAPLYSKQLWFELNKSSSVDYHFYSSFKGVSGIKTIPINNSIYRNKNGTLKWSSLKNIYIKGIIIFQFGLIYKCLNSHYDIYIFNGEMNNISTWIGAIICRLKKKKVFFWGHGLYGDEKGLKKWLRIQYFRLANGHLLYGNRAKRIMSNIGFEKERLHVVFNSIDYEKHQNEYTKRDIKELEKLKEKIFKNEYKKPAVLFIGRLTANKKLHLLIKAIKKCKEKGYSFNCLFVGGGSEKEKLKEEINLIGLKNSIRFYGASYDEETNSKLIMLSDCCVSPGNVGLTAIHCLSYGTPVITHDNLANQNPEVEAIINGKTGLLFKENDINNLADTIINIITSHKKYVWEKNCIAEIEKNWTPKKHAYNFDKAIISTLST